jgi:hypothetical protein
MTVNPRITETQASNGGRVRILRVIARMNNGGPACHVSLLSGKLDSDHYETLLVSGDVNSFNVNSLQSELRPLFSRNVKRIRSANACRRAS